MKKHIKFPKFVRSAYVGLSLLLAAVNLFIFAGHALALPLSNSYIRLNRMKTATDSTMRVVFKTSSTSPTGITGLTINMNGADSSTWTGSSGTVSTTQAISATSGCDVSATALPGSPTASGSSATITVSGLSGVAASTLYCFDLTTATSVHTPTAGEYHPVITEVGGPAESTTVAVRVVSNDSVSVTATVPPNFNFAISGCASNTDNFTANLSPSSTVSTTGCTITVNTNAANGWFAWAQDANTGLTSATTSKTITGSTAGSQVDLSGGNLGSNQYGLAITAKSNGGSCASGVSCGTVSLVAAYDSTTSGGANSLVGGVDTTLRNIASCSGPSNAATLTVKMRANVNPTVPPASDYTDTVTYVGAGYF